MIKSAKEAEKEYSRAKKLAKDNFFEEALNLLLDISAFYERGNLFARKNICENLMNRALSHGNSSILFNEMEGFCLGYNEESQSILFNLK